MNIIPYAILAFVILECANISLLYFAPGMKIGNSVGSFKSYEKSKQLPDVHEFVKYLIHWVAGTKLIFIALLVVILIKADQDTQLWCAIALIPSIATFFWRLFPAIKKMDNDNEITPKGYSKTLGIMIVTFIVLFLVAVWSGIVHA